MEKRKVNSLGALRGLAVLMVCFCHFAAPLKKNNFFSETFYFLELNGIYGVHIFFVISGFVIPLSMDKANYSFKYYFHFLYKRALRLHPPFLAALIITYTIVFLADYVKHIPFSETPIDIIKSAFYLYLTPSNPVFWTLQVEVQYY
ncbi:MAG TPA: acyltransferase family protein, partial [Pedobacter sp.]